MSAIGEVALPFFALIGLGYVAVRWRLVPEGSVAGLNGFVFFVTLPALLFAEIASAPTSELFDARVLTVYYVPTLAVLLGTAVISRQFLGTPDRLAIVQGLSGSWSNSGYMGIPLLLSFAGPEAALIAVLVLVFDNLITSPIAVAVIEVQRSGAARFGTALAKAARGLARHPLILASGVGLLAAVSNVVPPTPVATVVDLLAGATVPCALFALGGSLVGVPVSDARREIAVLTVIKLAVHPTLVALMAYVVIPLEATKAMAAVIVAALPTGAMVFVLAQRYETYVLRASTVVLATHLVSVLTVSALLAIYGGRGP